jgi:iron complex outermembrane recepter protein
LPGPASLQWQAGVLLNTQGNPPRLKLDSTIAPGYENFIASTTFNFTNSDRDTASSVTPTVASWTTVDMGLKYVFGGNAGPESGKNHGAAQNVSDKGPPFLQNANLAYQLGYDPENVDPPDGSSA